MVPAGFLSWISFARLDLRQKYSLVNGTLAAQSVSDSKYACNQQWWPRV